MLSLLACVLLAPIPFTPLDLHSPFENASKASQALSRQFYYELAAAKFPFGLAVREFDGADVLFSDGSYLLFEYSHIRDKLKVKAIFTYENLTISHSFICRYELTEDEEDRLKYLVMWHLITVLNPSKERLKEMGELYEYYPLD